ALVEPGSQDLDFLHRRLIELEMSWRGHMQAKPLAVAYDWLYDQWNLQQRKELLAKVIEASNYLIERIRVEQRLSPYNVYLYNSPFQALMATALASYGDSPEAELPMRWTADYWKNRILPVWRQVMGKHGGWHEGGEYVGIGIGQAIYQLPAMWRKATREDLFKSESGIRGFLDFLIYRTRPDGTHMRWGDAAFFDRMVPDRVPLAIEYSHAAAYSLDRCPRPYEPSSWPWGPLTTDDLCEPEAHRQLPLQKHFDGIGMVIARSSWDDESTYLTFKAGDNFWSHSHLDQGAFTIFKGGPLAIDSGLYGPSYGSDHHMNYSYQTIAHNVITVTDPEDTIPAPPKKEGGSPRQIANDGGQRRVGSGWGVESAPLDLNEWLEKSEIYQTGGIEKYHDKDDLVVAVANITPAYTNKYSGRGYFSHRTRRVEKYWRTIVYDRINDVVIVSDDLVSADPMFRKKSLIHTINEPRRTEDGFVAQIPANDDPDRKAGRLQARILFPKEANVSIIGGKNLEFLVDNINFDEGGAVWEKVLKRKKNPPEPGRWRVEVSPAIAQKRDRFMMILQPSVENQESNLAIRRLLTEKAIGSVIEGPYRTLVLSFPEEREGVIIEIQGKGGSKALDLTVKTETPVSENLWQRIRHAFFN
ncbi:MAG: heparinase II/III family protein, partial [Halioglobus sp.]